MPPQTRILWVFISKSTRFLGLLSSRAILYLMIFVLITTFLPLFLPHHRVWQNAIMSYYRIDPPPGFREYLVQYAHFLTSPLLLVLFACFHDLAPRPRKIFSHIALNIIIISVGFRILVLLWQPLINHFDLRAVDNENLRYQFYNMIRDLISPVYYASATVMTGLAELFIIPVLSGSDRIEKNLMKVFLISGIMNVLSFVPFEINNILNTGLIFVLSQMLMIVVMIFCIKYFKQLKQLPDGR